MKLTADLIESFAGVFLSPLYDNPHLTPQFHRECWELYCQDEVLAAAVAAPRKHGKTTALTHDFVLAAALFRWQQYIMVIGSSEELATENLSDIADELRDNEDLRQEFKIKDLVVDQRTDVVVECLDGYQFRIVARGAEQKIRGRKWHGKRIGLIVCDDLEDDEQVENRERRRKFRRWFFRACKQALREGGVIRVHGTILHEDSLLAHLMKNRSWTARLYKACRSATELACDILWPDGFSAERLGAIKQEFLDAGDLAGFAQEYLNDPRDREDAYLNKAQFLSMRPEDYESFKVYSAGLDFAVSKHDKANRTAIVVGGQDLENTLHHEDFRAARWDALEILEEMFSVQLRWKPRAFYVEGGVIWKAIEPMIYAEMRRRDIWLNLVVLNPTKDKASRGKSFQKRMKAGGCRFDKQHPEYLEYEDECLRFSGETEAIQDDYFDASATLSLGLENASAPEAEDELTEEEQEFERESMIRRVAANGGRSLVTGY